MSMAELMRVVGDLPAEQQIITRLFEELAEDPYRAGDYSERDAIGRPVQVLITGSRAICFLG